MINILWAGMFLCAVVVAFYRLIFLQDTEIFGKIVDAIFKNSQAAVDISLGLIGILSFWLGILKLIEESGLAGFISKKLSPFFQIIMKDIPHDSPAISTVVLNMAANFLGLDNAATPMGIRAMEQLQSHNSKKDTASDAQILFMIINASSVTLIPMTIFMYRAQMGASYPTDVFIPILLATSVSTLVGFFSVALKQRIDLKQPLLLKFFCSFILIIGALVGLFYWLPIEKRLAFSAGLGNIILLALITAIILICIHQKTHCYEAFVDGAKEGFTVAIRILPYLLAMLVVIGVFRAAGILDFLVDGAKAFCHWLSVDDRFVDALPTALMKPLSGSGARAMMIESMQTFGADSFAAFTSSVIQGSTETTFYVLTVYFGAINISKTRYALKYALLSDIAGITAAIGLAYLFYNN
ncbi:hypothetical protein IJ556_06230 [bacterium]|nr:hypothetical protein [bacterium]MBR2274169.1 hypothetical protein [Alphaproteobacteria bacterium]